MQKIHQKLSLFLAVLVVLSLVLSACSKNTNEPSSSTAPDATTAPSAAPVATPVVEEKEVTLRFYFTGVKKPATDEVWNAISDYVKQKGLNVKFDINVVDYGDYAQKLLVMSASGDTWDMNFDANWLAYQQMASKGAYLNLNELLPKYAPNLAKVYAAQGSLAAATVNGEVVALPWTLKQNVRPFFAWRSDLTTKQGIEPAKDSIKTVEDIDQFVHKLKEANPNVRIGAESPVVTSQALGMFAARDELIDLGFHLLVVELNDPKLQVKPYEQTQAYRDAAKLAKKWYDDGIINKDALVDKQEAGSKWTNGKSLVQVTAHEYANNTPNFADKSWTLSSSQIYPDKKFVNRSPLANVVAINKNSKNPDKVLRFLDMLETDQTLYDLVHYGIEGKTYVLDGKIANYPGDMTAATSNYMEWGGQWALWKPQFMRPNQTYSEGFWSREAEFATLPQNVNSPLDGLFILDDNIKTEVAKRDQLQSELGKSIEYGIVADADKAVDDYIAKQKDAGLDKIIADVQKQVDDFIASKK